ncbi:putative RDD family membrane protein YckC [Phycicoccus badiiscoriae]|uniref:Putative RDD family membrane protein YckC n=1 Tax=Pedococcus badiiscoriae TaxID=642776 RepID=A0A852WGI8_9MICO|nr:RDD family protein [Pedococcus badiiscoriae]NYG07920.1 putative RDD family membrane protein YckC [Pedococcus badiiscoriae]
MSTPTTPGWYDDPEDDSRLRYFDGVVWSKHTTPRSTRPVPSVTQPGQQQFPGQGHPAQYPGQGSAQPPAAGGWQQPPAAPPQGHQNPQFPGTQQPGWSAPPQHGWAQPSGPTTPDGQPLASYGQRVLAFVIDFIATSVIAGVLSLPVQLQVRDDISSTLDGVANGSATLSDVFNAAMRATADHVVALTLIALASSVLYHVLFVGFFSATPGKMALGISIRRPEAPGRVGWAIAVRRRLLQTILGLLRLSPALDILYLLGSALDLLWPAWDPRRQALHDKVAGTVVVRGRAPRR